jgi:signal transduction histidine kinase
MRKRKSGWLTGQDGSSPFAAPSQHQAMVAAFSRMLTRQAMAMEGASVPRKQVSVVAATSKTSDSGLLRGDWRTDFGPHMVFEHPSGRFMQGSGGFAAPQFVISGPDANLIAGNAIRPAAVGLAFPQRRSSKTPAGALREDKSKALLFHPHFEPWFIDERIPALLRPLLSEAQVRGGAGPAHGDWIIVELDKKVLQERIFPDLAERYFDGAQGSSYDIAVRADARNELIYSSGSGFGKQRNEAGDARLGLFGGLGAGPGASSGPARVSFAVDHNSRDPRTELQKSGYRVTGSTLLPFQSGMPDGWELLARHRKGSLDAAVAGLRRRNLEISFGVLLVLGVTMAMVIVNTRRAQRLAMLQMDFVAGVSHELRTPLAVIRSAADNIADGIVSDKAKLARYGKLIRDHTRKLNSLVEQILSFAAAQKQNHHYNFVRVQPPEILESVLRDSAEMIQSAGFTLDKEIEPNLPAVVVDMSAVSHCLQNLISNAVKYGGDARWIGVRAHATGKEVQISVQDKGIGMEASELRHIFDPFYRTPSVVAAQIHGTGLGLALARSMAEAIGGRLTVSSRLGKGSTFTLHLPYADQHTVSKEAAAAVSAGSLQN